MKSATRFLSTPRLLALTSAAAMVFGSTALGQVSEAPVPPPSATPAPQEAGPLDDKKLDQYADAYVDVEHIERTASAQLEDAQDAATAVAIKEKAEGKIIEAIERNGLNLGEFNQITEVAALDNRVRLKIEDLVEKHRPI